MRSTLHVLGCFFWIPGLAFVGARVVAAEQNPLILSGDEQAWIAKHPVIRVACNGDAPYFFKDSNGKMVGIDREYLSRVSRMTGLQFPLTVEPDLMAAFTDLKAQRADLVASALGQTKEREEFMLFTDTYAFSPDVYVTRTDASYIFDVRELAGKRIGFAGSSVDAVKEANRIVPDAKVLIFADMPAAVRAVARGEVDAARVDAIVAAFIARTEGLSNLRLGDVGGSDANVHFGVRKDWPELVAILNKALGQIPQTERNAIRDRWIKLDFEAGHRWRRAFSIALVGVVIALVVFAVGLFYHRRLKRELALRVQLQTELERTRDNLAQASQEKSALLSVLAHDLRSPVNGFLIGIEILSADSEDKRMAGPLLEMRTAAEQMLRLMNDLLNAQAIEEGHRVYRSDRLDLGSLLQEAVTATNEAARRKQINLTLQRNGDLELQSDATAIRQIAENLISNAIKYSPPRGKVRVVLSRMPQSVVLSVSDSGPGIDLTDQKKMFQKFGRSTNRPTAGESSMGVGLWIVKHIVTDLQGTVACDSKMGVGTTFTIELPLEPSMPTTV